jgi:hypothetical protein
MDEYQVQPINQHINQPVGTTHYNLPDLKQNLKQKVQMSAPQAGSLLANYGIDPTHLYSPQNIQSTLTRPNAAPDDLLGIRSQIQYDTGWLQAQREYEDLVAQSDAYRAQTQMNMQSMGDWLLNAEAVTGEKRSYQEQRLLGEQNLEIALSRAEQKLGRLSDEVNLRTSVAEKNIDFIRQMKITYPGANISFGDSLDDIENKLTKFQEAEEKKVKKSALKSALLELGLKTSGSMRELERRLQKANANKYKMTLSAAEMEMEKSRISLESARLSLNKQRESLSPQVFNPASAFSSTTPSSGQSPIAGFYGNSSSQSTGQASGGTYFINGLGYSGIRK